MNMAIIFGSGQCPHHSPLAAISHCIEGIGSDPIFLKRTMLQCNCISSNNALQCVECNRTYQCDTQCNAMQCNEFIALHCNVMCALGALVVSIHPIILKHSAV